MFLVGLYDDMFLVDLIFLDHPTELICKVSTNVIESKKQSILELFQSIYLLDTSFPSSNREYLSKYKNVNSPFKSIIKTPIMGMGFNNNYRCTFDCYSHQLCIALLI